MDESKDSTLLGRPLGYFILCLFGFKRVQRCPSLDPKPQPQALFLLHVPVARLQSFATWVSVSWQVTVSFQTAIERHSEDFVVGV